MTFNTKEVLKPAWLLKNLILHAANGQIHEKEIGVLESSC